MTRAKFTLARLEKLKMQKTGPMRGLLTGKVPVKVEMPVAEALDG